MGLSALLKFRYYFLHQHVGDRLVVQPISFDFLGVFLNCIVDLRRYQENAMATIEFDLPNVVGAPLAGFLISKYALNQFGHLITVHAWHLDVC